MAETLHTGKNKRRWQLFIPRIIRHDFWRKLIALSLALISYFFIQFKIGDENHFKSIPVKINLPPKLINLDQQIPRVTVTLRGSKSKLNKFSNSDIRIVANVEEKKFTAGMPYNLKLTPDDVTVPFGFTVTKIAPSELVLNLEEVIQKKVSVKPVFDAKQLPNDYIVGKITVIPPEVWISGASSLIKNIESVDTEAIPLQNQTESFEYSAKLQSSSNYKLTLKQVTVKVEILKYLDTRTINTVPIKVLRPSNESSDVKVELLSSPNVDVTINGPQSKVNIIKPAMLKPYIDISDLEVPGKYTITVGCYIGIDGVKLVSLFPKQVTVKLSRKTEVTKDGKTASKR